MNCHFFFLLYALQCTIPWILFFYKTNWFWMRWTIRFKKTSTSCIYDSKLTCYNVVFIHNLVTKSHACNARVPYWYVSNVSIIFDCSMLLYYQSWMFHNHFIVILYPFLVLTYWHSAKCQLLFSACYLHRRKSISDGVLMQRNFTKIFYGPEDT